MLKIETIGEGAAIEAKGSTMEMGIELVALITGIYHQLKRSGQDRHAEVFKGFIMKCTREGGAAWEEPGGRMTGITLDKNAWDKLGRE